MNHEKLTVDIFIKYSTRNLIDFKAAINKGISIMIKDIHLDERFIPKKYVRYYLTFKIIKFPENQPLPQFNIVQQRIERLHNAAISLEILEQKLNNLDVDDKNLFCYFEIGGIYVLEEDLVELNSPWYQIRI